MNYTELSAAIQEYTQNYETDFVANIPLFVNQAEIRIYNTVQFPSLRKNTTGFTTSAVKYLSCPLDFLAVYSLAVISGGEYTYLLNKDVNFIREAYPSTSVADYGLPRYYSLFGPATTNTVPPTITNELTFLLGPTPNDAYEMELHYYYYPESIVTANTSWLGDNFDTVLLYGSLMEAYTFMKGEPDILANYTARYQEALAQAKRLGDGMERGDAYRDGQIKLPVT